MASKADRSKPAELGRRLREALGDREWSEADLVRELQKIAPDADREKMSQPMVNYVLSGKAERSFYTPLFAEALGCSAAWLAFGVGPKEPPSGGDLPPDERALLQAYNALPKELRLPIRMMIESFYQVLRDKYHADDQKIREMQNTIERQHTALKRAAKT